MYTIELLILGAGEAFIVAVFGLFFAMIHNTRI